MREIEGGEFREHFSCENHHMEGFAGRICTECGGIMKFNNVVKINFTESFHQFFIFFFGTFLKGSLCIRSRV